MKSTQPNGFLNTLNNKCYIEIPGHQTIHLRILPEISDRKSAKYSDESVIGRSTPLKSYSHSDNRTLSLKLQFLSLNKYELQENLYNYYAISSLTYPRSGEEIQGPYAPPSICKLRCGDMLRPVNFVGGNPGLSVILDSYDLNIPKDIVRDDETLIPYYFTLSTTWNVVYPAGNLPNQEDVMWGTL